MTEQGSTGATPSGARRVVANGLEFAVTDTGPGSGADAREPVLLLHGFPDSRLVWRHQVPALAAAGHRVIAPDLRGFGESERPEGVAAYAVPELVGDVLGLLDALEVERVAVVGHDWGAVLAWTLARMVPHRVSRLTAISVGHPVANATAGLAQRQLSWYMLWFQFPGVAEKVLPADGWRFFREWAWGGVAAGQDPDADRQVADLSRPGALVAGLNWYRANIAPDRFAGSVRGPLPGPDVTCPVMGVWSSGDMALTEEQMTGSERFVAGPWRYERLDAVSHWVPVHAPERLNGLLLDFLRH